MLRDKEYDTRCYFNVHSKADISQLNLPNDIGLYSCAKSGHDPWRGWVEEPLEVLIFAKTAVFCHSSSCSCNSIQKLRQFGAKQYTTGLLSHVKYGPEKQRGCVGKKTIKLEYLIKSAGLLAVFVPTKLNLADDSTTYRARIIILSFQKFEILCFRGPSQSLWGSKEIQN